MRSDLTMKHFTLRDLDVGRVGLDTMGMSAAYTGAGADEPEAIRTIHRAIDTGVTVIDTAEVYGPMSTRNSSVVHSRAAETT